MNRLLTKMASPAQLSIESTSPGTLCVHQPEGFDAAFHQNGYPQYSVVSSRPILSKAFSKYLARSQMRAVASPPQNIAQQAYAERIKTLQEAAEEEGIAPIAASLDAFFNFINGTGFQMRTAALFLSEDGSYAAIWRNEAWRLHIKFLGDDAVEYVLLDRTADLPKGGAGSATFDELNNLIAAKDLKALLQA